MQFNIRVYIGDGIIPQVERFASKYVYNRLTVSTFKTAMAMMNEKATQPTGNKQKTAQAA